MTLVHDASRAAGGAGRSRSATTPIALVETYLAGARDLEVAIIGNDALELYGRARSSPATSSTTTPRSTRRACPRRPPRPRSARAQKATILKLARDTYRAIGCEGFARVDFLVAGERIVVSEINTIPGFTPISLFPTMPSAGGYTSRTSASASSSSRRDRAAGRGHRPPQRERTCRDEPPSADPPPDTAGAGPPDTPRPARVVGAADADPGRRRARRCSPASARSTASRRRAPSTTRASGSTAAPVWTDPAAVEAAIAGARGQNLFRISTDPLEAALEKLPTVDARPHRRRVPRHPGRDARRAHADPDLEGRRPAVPRRRRRQALRRAAGRAQRGDGRAAGRGRPAVRLGRPDRRAARLDPVDLDAATRLASLVPADVGSAATGLSIVLTDENGFLVRSEPARLDRGLRHLHADDPHARTSSRSRSACCAACSSGARTPWSG